MRTFKKMNKSVPEDVCPICNTQDEGEVVLIGIAGTQQDRLCEAKQFHLRCIDLWYDRKCNIIYQQIKRKEQ